MNTNEILKLVEEHFGSRTNYLGQMIIELSRTQQPCDVTFYKRKPALDVKIDASINYALMYGAGSKKLKEMLEAIQLSNGDRASFGEIWTVNPMPADGLSEDELQNVDLTEGEQVAGPNGETIREMNRDTYHCENAGEEEFYLRRFIAS